MTHVKRFRGIPMSKSMRGLCKEEDYAFLGASEKTAADEKQEDKASASGNDWRIKEEERDRRRLRREQQETERLRRIEEAIKEKEQQWQTHIEKLTSSQRKTLQGRRERLRIFRELQEKVLVEESEQTTEDKEPKLQLLTRM